MYTVTSECRACRLGKPEIPTLKISCAAGPQSDQSSLIPVLDLGLHPLANDFCNQTEERAGYAPLKVMYCPRCSLAQLSVIVDPKILYATYKYVTSSSGTMHDHFSALADNIIEEVPNPRTVLEIGSNDGTFLKFLKGRGFSYVVGIDPAGNLVRKANEDGVFSIENFFNYESGSSALTYLGRYPDLIIARHVFCHIPDWRGFLGTLRTISGEDTLIAIEVPHVRDQVEAVSFDQVYHEHLSYLTPKAMKFLLADTDFHLHRIVHYPIHGGSVVFFIRRNSSSARPHPSVQEFLSDEVTLKDWLSFNDEAHKRIQTLSASVRNLVSQGYKVVGYGASAKSTVWLNACGFSRKEISFICDNTNDKQYRFAPGTDIPIVDPGALTRELPDFAICFAWQYFEEIRKNESIFWDKGRTWIVPVPSLNFHYNSAARPNKLEGDTVTA